MGDPCYVLKAIIGLHMTVLNSNVLISHHFFIDRFVVAMDSFFAVKEVSLVGEGNEGNQDIIQLDRTSCTNSV